MAINTDLAVRFIGIDQEISKLAKMDALLESIKKKAGSIGGIGNGLNNLGNNGGNRNIIVPPSHNGALTSAGEGVVASTIVSKGFKESMNKFILDLEKSPKLTSAGKKLAASYDPLGMINNPVSIKEPAPRTHELDKPPAQYRRTSKSGILHDFFAGLGGHDESKKKGDKEEGEGLGSKQGMRELFRAGGLGREARSLLMSFKGLGLAAGVIVVAVFAFKQALELTIEGIKEAGDAFKHAAKEGVSVAEAERLKNAFAQLGMAVPDLTKIRYQLGKGNDTNAILGAAKSGQLGSDGQQLLNMAGQFKSAMNESNQAANEMALAANAGYNISRDWTIVVREFKAIFVQLGAALYPIIKLFTMVISQIFKSINDKLFLINILLGHKSAGKDNSMFPTGGLGSVGVSPTERMGFVMNGSGHNTSVADNTYKMVQLLKSIDNKIGGGSRGNNTTTPLTYNPAVQFQPIPFIP